MQDKIRDLHEERKRLSASENFPEAKEKIEQIELLAELCKRIGLETKKENQK